MCLMAHHKLSSYNVQCHVLKNIDDSSNIGTYRVKVCVMQMSGQKCFVFPFLFGLYLDHGGRIKTWSTRKTDTQIQRCNQDMKEKSFPNTTGAKRC